MRGQTNIINGRRATDPDPWTTLERRSLRGGRHCSDDVHRSLFVAFGPGRRVASNLGSSLEPLDHSRKRNSAPRTGRGGNCISRSPRWRDARIMVLGGERLVTAGRSANFGFGAKAMVRWSVFIAVMTIESTRLLSRARTQKSHRAIRAGISCLGPTNTGATGSICGVPNRVELPGGTMVVPHATNAGTTENGSESRIGASLSGIS